MEENNNVVNSNKKNAIIGLVAVVAVILVIILGINLFGSSPEKVLKKYCKYLSKGDFSKAYDLVDFESSYVLASLDEDEYEDFNDELKDFKDSDDYEDFEDDMEDLDEYIEELEEDFEDFDKFDIELKEVKSSKKVKGTKNLYKVKAKIKYKIEINDYDSSDTETMEIYMIKKGMKYYLVQGFESFINY